MKEDQPKTMLMSVGGEPFALPPRAEGMVRDCFIQRELEPECIRDTLKQRGFKVPLKVINFWIERHKKNPSKWNKMHYRQPTDDGVYNRSTRKWEFPNLEGKVFDVEIKKYIIPYVYNKETTYWDRRDYFDNSQPREKRYPCPTNLGTYASYDPDVEDCDILVEYYEENEPKNEDEKAKQKEAIRIKTEWDAMYMDLVMLARRSLVEAENKYMPKDFKFEKDYSNYFMERDRNDYYGTPHHEDDEDDEDGNLIETVNNKQQEETMPPRKFGEREQAAGTEKVVTTSTVVKPVGGVNDIVSWTIEKNTNQGFGYLDTVSEAAPTPLSLQAYGSGTYRSTPRFADGEIAGPSTKFIILDAEGISKGNAAVASANSQHQANSSMENFINWQTQQANAQIQRDERDRKERRAEELARQERFDKLLLAAIPVVTAMVGRAPAPEKSNDKFIEYLVATAKNRDEPDPIDQMTKILTIKTLAKEMRDEDDEGFNGIMKGMVESMGPQLIDKFMAPKALPPPGNAESGASEPSQVNARTLVQAMKRNKDFVKQLMLEISKDPEASKMIAQVADEQDAAEKQNTTEVSKTESIADSERGPKKLRRVG